MGGTRESLKEAPAGPSVDEIVRNLVEVVPTPVIVADEAGLYVYVTPAARQFFGRSVEDLIGAEVLDSIVPREREEVCSYLRSSATDEPGRRSMTMLGRDGDEREGVLHHSRLELRGLRLLTGIIEDVTETRRVRREAVALAQSAATVGINRSLDATLDALAQSVVETTSAIAAAFYLLESDGDLRPASTFGLPRGYAEAIYEAGKQGAPRAALKAIEARATVIDEDVISRRLADPRFAPVRALIRAEPWSVIVSLPLMHQNGAVGALNGFYPARPGPPGICMS